MRQSIAAFAFSISAFVWTRSGADTFAANMRAELGIAVEPVTGLGQATRASDVIVTCTPAKKWFLGREHVRAGTFIAAVSADGPDKQEIEPELLAGPLSCRTS